MWILHICLELALWFLITLHFFLLAPSFCLLIAWARVYTIYRENYLESFHFVWILLIYHRFNSTAFFYSRKSYYHVNVIDCPARSISYRTKKSKFSYMWLSIFSASCSSSLFNHSLFSLVVTSGNLPPATSLSLFLTHSYSLSFLNLSHILTLSFSFISHTGSFVVADYVCVMFRMFSYILW